MSLDNYKNTGSMCQNIHIKFYCYSIVSSIFSLIAFLSSVIIIVACLIKIYYKNVPLLFSFTLYLQN